MDSNISSEIHIALCVDEIICPTVVVQSVYYFNNSSGNKIIFYIVHFPNIKGIELIIEHINKAGYRGIAIEVSDLEFIISNTSPLYSSVYLRLLLPNILPEKLKELST